MPDRSGSPAETVKIFKTNLKVRNTMKKRILSFALAFVLMLAGIPAIPVSADNAASTLALSTMVNPNVADGISLYKSARPHVDEQGNPDGTVDIIIQTFTDGAVTTHASSQPTDIVLVLDVSGSMADKETVQKTVYNEAYGTAQWQRTGRFGQGYWYYGMGTSGNYYVQESEGVYRQVTRIGLDANNFIYYSYTNTNGETIYVYPTLGSSVDTYGASKANNYDTVQFYTRSTQNSSSAEAKIDTMKEAVTSFIDKTLELNNSLPSGSAKHRIAIIKYASDVYYNGGSSSIEDINNAVSALDNVGDNRFYNSYYEEYYNYTQVVQTFTEVDSTGAAELKTAVNNLTPGGATAVDFGLALAEAALDKRDAQYITANNEVVIVFTDGVPTHGNSYDSEVAGEAINRSLNLKNKDTTVYSISVLTGSNAAELGDQSNSFMHYVSSNYPKASYTGSSISAGSGSPTSGYYMTPTTGINLSGLFESIIQSIGAPKLTLGSDTAIYDELSPYFNFTTPSGEVNDITIQTLNAKASDGFDEAVTITDDPITASVRDEIITIKGFDFDANYISSTPRDGDFYGKMLQITINVTPDYAVIDASGSTDGVFITNDETAPLIVVDSAENVVAKTESPDVTMNKITYTVDGESYAQTYYRLPGANYSLLPEPTKAGYTFSGWKINGNDAGTSFTMPGTDVAIVGTFTAKEYTVSYEYVGDVPEGAGELPQGQTDVPFGTTVNVAANPTAPAGYTFSGWVSQEVTPVDSAFTMPNRDVTFRGRFTAEKNIPYKIIHYTEELDGTWKEYYSYDASGTAGEQSIEAQPLTIEGFTFDGSVEGTLKQGIIAGDGSLVLKLFYTRNSYTVTYEYTKNSETDTIPSDATSLPEEKTYKYGETVTVANKATAENYTFHGWFSSEVVVSSVTEFTMPATNVLIHGHFVRTGNIDYTVNHWLLRDPDSNERKDSYDTNNYELKLTENLKADAGEVTALPKSFTGFTYNAGISTAKGTVTETPKLELNLYYDRNRYDVTYGYIGSYPSDATELPAKKSYEYGATVTVAEAATANGYNFVGWTSLGGTLQNVVNPATFEMPAQNVVLRGQFTQTPYKIQHYIQTKGTDKALESSYTLHSEESFTNGKAGDTLTILPKTITGYTYEKLAFEVNGVEINVDGSTVLKLYYVRDPEYTVTYEYTGTVPANAPAAPTDANSPYIEGETVNLLTVTEPAGYTFSGWTSDDVTIASGDTDFTMPASNVKLTGSFTAGEGKYVIHHHYEELDGTYTDEPETEVAAPVDKHITATLKSKTGFTYDNTHQDTKFAGTVPATGKLELHLYYKRNEYKVEYAYTGNVPTEAPALPATATYKYGATVTIAAKPTVEGHDFKGWNSDPQVFSAGMIQGETTFTMPAHDVRINGSFDNVSAAYRVEHYLQQNDGSYKLEEHSNLSGIIGETVAAVEHTFPGYVLNSTHPETIASGVVLANGSLILKLYYNLSSAPQFTVTYYVDGQLYRQSNVAAGASHTIISAPSRSGYTFSGWSEPQTDAGVAVPTTNGSFTMPYANVEIRGSFTEKDPPFIILDGVIELTKLVDAPADFPADTSSFDFDIYKKDGDAKKLVKSITVETGVPYSLRLPIGTYYIYEDAASVEGYSLNTTSNLVDNTLKILPGETHEVEFLNTYSALALETEDHFGYIIGYPDGLVHPEAYITRAEVATIFFRMMTDASRDYYMSSESGFTDVNAEDWFNRAISTLVAAGVLEGYGDGTYLPNEYITRAELTKIAVSFYGTHAGAESHLSDVSEHWAEKFVESAYDYGFIEGYPDGEFKPDQFITRAEAMKIVNRTLGRTPDKDYLLDGMIEWPDNMDTDAWFYAEVQEATNSHDYTVENGHEVWTAILPMRDWAALERDDEN